MTTTTVTVPAIAATVTVTSAAAADNVNTYNLGDVNTSIGVSESRRSSSWLSMTQDADSDDDIVSENIDRCSRSAGQRGHV